MRLARLAVPLLLAGCHSDAFVTGSYGASGVLFPGPEARLTFSIDTGYQANVPSYSQDGSLIIYRFSPRYPQLGQHLIPGPRGKLIRADSLDSCLAGLPAGGGSALWAFCETSRFHTDTTDSYVTAALGSANQLLYVESSGSADLPIPVRFHAELWLANPAQPLVDRVKLRQLYHESGFGISADDSTAVNWLTGLAFRDAASFIALGWSRWADGSLHPYGVVTGSIQGGDAALTRIAGTEKAIGYTPAAIAGGVLFFDGQSLTIRSTTGVFASLPTLGGRSITGVSCAAARCVVLTREPPVQGVATSMVWGLDLATGALKVLRANVLLSESIALSPASSDAVIDAGTNLYLLTAIAP